MIYCLCDLDCAGINLAVETTSPFLMEHLESSHLTVEGADVRYNGSPCFVGHFI